MTAMQLLVLALVQGVTEFLPISSSGHLILTRDLLGWHAAANTELILDVAVHVGTLGAIVIYFWRDVLWMLGGLLSLARGRAHPGGRMALLIAAATVPVVMVGAAAEAIGLIDALRTPLVIGWTTLGFGVVLYGVDRLVPPVHGLGQMTLGHALFIGLAQVLALVPGTSRSGITMTAARLLGYERTEAARFSMLMSIPVIVAAGTLKGLELVRAGDTALAWDVVGAAAMALIAALIAVGLMMRWLARATFTPFVVYRLLLGALILWLVGIGYFAPAA